MEHWMMNRAFKFYDNVFFYQNDWEYWFACVWKSKVAEIRMAILIITRRRKNGDTIFLNIVVKIKEKLLLKFEMKLYQNGCVS